jgi:hypothetical protein
MNAVAGAHMKEYRKKWKTTAGGTIPTRIEISNFQLPQMNFIESPGNYCLPFFSASVVLSF